MKRIFGFLTLFFAFFIASAQQQQQQGGSYLDMHYTFSKGQAFELEQKSKTENYVTVDGVVQRTTRDYNNVISIEVTNVEPGKTTLTFKYKDLKFNFNAKNNNIFVDAKVSKPDEPFQGALKLILDQPFTVELQTTGIINKVEGLDVLVDKASEAFNTLKKDEQEAYKKLIKDQFGTDAFRGWLEQLLVMYPAHGVKTGTQWEENVPMRGELVGRVDLYWTLQTWDSQTAKVNGTSKIKTDKIQTLRLDDDIKATAEINGTTSSNYLINLSSGFPSICVQNSEMSGNYTYIAKKMKNNKKVPAKIITNASYKIKQLK